MVGGYSQDRLSDVYHPDFSDNRATYISMSLWSILPKLVVSAFHSLLQEVTLQCEKLKDAKHAEEVERVGGVFVLLVVESLGIWPPFGVKILKQIAAQSTKCSALDANVAAKHLHVLQQLSVKLWMYNAKLLLHLYLL